jgi:hypothetical protein
MHRPAPARHKPFQHTGDFSRRRATTREGAARGGGFPERRTSGAQQAVRASRVAALVWKMWFVVVLDGLQRTTCVLRRVQPHRDARWMEATRAMIQIRNRRDFRCRNQQQKAGNLLFSPAKKNLI